MHGSQAVNNCATKQMCICSTSNKLGKGWLKQTKDPFLIFNSAEILRVFSMLLHLGLSKEGIW
jgi:hypothetical protein